jgi:hypothetical protein
MPRPGEPAPPLIGTAHDGTPIDIAAWRPAMVVVEFFRGTW